MKQTGKINDRGLLDLVRARGVLKTGHFILAENHHSANFIRSCVLGTLPDLSTTLAYRLAIETAESRLFKDVGSVVAISDSSLVTLNPFVSIFGFSVRNGRGLRCAWAKGVCAGGCEIDPAFAGVIRGRKVLIHTTSVLTGHSVLKTVDAIRRFGGVAVGVATVFNCCPNPEVFGGLPVVSLLDLSGRVTPHNKPCPLCRARRPISQDLGFGKEFLALPGKPPKKP